MLWYAFKSYLKIQDKRFKKNIKMLCQWITLYCIFCLVSLYYSILVVNGGFPGLFSSILHRVEKTSQVCLKGSSECEHRGSYNLTGQIFRYWFLRMIVFDFMFLQLLMQKHFKGTRKHAVRTWRYRDHQSFSCTQVIFTMRNLPQMPSKVSTSV